MLTQLRVSEANLNIIPAPDLDDSPSSPVFPWSQKLWHLLASLAQQQRTLHQACSPGRADLYSIFKPLLMVVRFFVSELRNFSPSF